MKVLWANSPLSASEIIAALSRTKDWHPNTIKTLLSRLHKKKVVGVEKQKNLYMYRPLVSEAACVRTESESFLQRFFGGAVKPLLMHFAQNRKLSTDDLEELRKVLNQKKK
jgi:BlaI family penicillinase repressor